MMKGIIDRFEGEWVVVEIDGETQDFNRSIFPKEAEVGDVVVFTDGQVELLKEETQQLKKEIEQLMEELWED